MIHLYSREEINCISVACRIVAKVLDAVGHDIVAGVRTGDLDRRISALIKAENAEPAFLGYRGYPAASCISINEEVVHGIPGRRRLKEGDIVSIDIGVHKDGYIGDAARTWAVGAVSRDKARLMAVTQKALERGIEQAHVGNRISDISAAVEDTVRAENCQAVRDLVGHGVGKNLHEDPQIPNYRSGEIGAAIRNGMVLAIEPMINLGGWQVDTLDDDWTVVTRDRKPSAHYEHTVAVLDGAARILTAV